MYNFDYPDSYSKEANFEQIKFGEGAPLTERELNELQSILNNRLNDVVKHLAGDCILNVGEYSFSEGTLSIKDEIAFVDGHLFKINNSIGDLAEGDVVGIQYTKKIVKGTDTLHEDGNEQGKRVENKIIDNRYGEETSRRVLLSFNLVKFNAADILPVNITKLGCIQSNSFKSQLPELVKISEVECKINQTLETRVIRLKEYIDGQLSNITETGVPKLVKFEYEIQGKQGDDSFKIPLTTFDSTTDVPMLFINTTFISRSKYNIENGYIKLLTPLEEDKNIVLIVEKNVPIGEEGSVSGKVISNNTLSDDKLTEKIIDDTVIVPKENKAGKLGEVLNWLGNAIKNITGKESWRDKPTKNMEELNKELMTHQADSMNKSTYDTNNNGKVDIAEKAEEVSWDNITGKPYTFDPSSHTHSAEDITETYSRKFVSSSEKSSWNNKVDKEYGKGLSTNDFSTSLKEKLEKLKMNDDGSVITDEYVHPATHPATMIKLANGIDVEDFYAATVVVTTMVNDHEGKIKELQTDVEKNKDNITTVHHNLTLHKVENAEQIVVKDISDTLVNGWEISHTEEQGFKVSKSGNIVSFMGGIKGGVLTAGTVIGTLPVGYRPHKEIYAPVLNGGNNAQTKAIWLYPSGEVQISNRHGDWTSGIIYFAISYIL